MTKELIGRMYSIPTPNHGPAFKLVILLIIDI